MSRTRGRSWPGPGDDRGPDRGTSDRLMRGRHPGRTGRRPWSRAERRPCPGPGGGESWARGASAGPGGARPCRQFHAAVAQLPVSRSGSARTCGLGLQQATVADAQVGPVGRARRPRHARVGSGSARARCTGWLEPRSPQAPHGPDVDHAERRPPCLDILLGPSRAGRAPLHPGFSPGQAERRSTLASPPGRPSAAPPWLLPRAGRVPLGPVHAPLTLTPAPLSPVHPQRDADGTRRFSRLSCPTSALFRCR